MVIKNPDFDGSGSATNVKTSSFFPPELGADRDSQRRCLCTISEM